MLELTLIWGLLIGVSLLIYCVLDGFVLGAGVLVLINKKPEDQDVIVKTIGAVWDVNQTWLILGGAGLFASFPLAYATIFPCLYLPMTIFFIGLVLRGVSIEFRAKSSISKQFWTKCFGLGSFLVSLMQGIILGSLLKGLPIVNGVNTEGSFFWLSWFNLFTGGLMVLSNAFLASNWLILKTTYGLQVWAREISLNLAKVVLILMIFNSGFILYLDTFIYNRWMDYPYLFVMPALIIAFFIVLINAVKIQKSDFWPFMYNAIIIILSFLCLVVSNWPFVVPRVYTLWQSAIAPKSQFFLLIGVLMFLPMIISYTSYQYWVFRGKVKLEDDIYSIKDAVE